MIRCLFVLIILTLLFGCKDDDEQIGRPLINFKLGEYTRDGDFVPVGGKLTFAIVATGGGTPITNLRVQRIVNGNAITEIDKGLYIVQGGLDQEINAVKSSAESELWRFLIMNANRDTAVISLDVYLGEGSAWGPIKHFPSIKIGMQNNQEYPQFLDLHNGVLYSNETVVGNEANIDLLGFVYLTQDVMSPTLSCPQYSSVPGHYPIVANWTTRRSTLYDYKSVDNDLVNLEDFISATNDSILVVSYKPGNVSGLCKFCYTGKIVPFKTHQGKYGLIRVLYADQVPEGYMELEVKIQE